MAVILGWGLAGESLTGQMMIGAAIIVGSVALVTSQKRGASKKTSETKVMHGDPELSTCG